VQFSTTFVAHPYAGQGIDASLPNAAPHSQIPRGFSDWSASNSVFTSLAGQPAPATTNPPFNYNLSPSYALWNHYMFNKNVAYSYPAPTEDHAHTLRQDKESGTSPVYCSHHAKLVFFLPLSLETNNVVIYVASECLWRIFLPFLYGLQP
jgi:hypothetical protein